MKVEMDRLMLASSVAGAFIITLLLLPVLNLLFSAGFDGLLDAITDKNALQAIFTSFEAAFLATVLSFIFGVPLAYLMARKDFFGKSVIESVIDLPIVIPHTVAGIALLMVFGRNGIIGSPLNEIGIRLSDSMAGIVMAMMFVSSPFLINHAREAFESIDPKMENVAISLGATRAKAIWSITLPLSMRNLMVGSIMTWARAISEFGAVIIIAYFPMIAPTYIYSKYVEQGLYAAMPAAALMLVLTIVIFMAMRLVIHKWRRYDTD
ncbi:MAG: ABC transporter permease [Thermoplasmata archaeon]|nr:ABC transporter permease [Thermoplasmata archaeon]